MSIISRHQPKSSTYARFLDSIRSAGLWTQPTPINRKGAPITGSAPYNDGAGGLSWTEIIRKYLKHNPERGLTAEVATTELALRLLLVPADRTTEYDGDKVYLTDDPETGRAVPPPQLKTENVKIAEKHVAKLKESLAKHKVTEADPKSSIEQNAAKIVISFGYYIIGDYDKSLQSLENCTFEVSDSLTANLEKYDVILMVIGLAVKAFVLERQTADVSSILEAYDRVSATYASCLSHLSLGAGDELDKELHAWAELAMYRACIISRPSMPVMTSLEAHRRYHSFSKHWPLSFRLHQRSVIYKSYIKLLFIAVKSDSWKPPTGEIRSFRESSQISISVSQDGETPAIKLPLMTWKTELLMMERSYNAVLHKLTTFPKAGYTNPLMLEFCDLLFEGWQLSGSDVESTSDIIEMLHDATQKTFHSQRVLRYLIQVLDVQQDWDEAEAALDVYYQLYTTSSTNESPTNSSEPLDKTPRPVPNGIPVNGNCESLEQNGNILASDRDSNKDFIETIIYGSRMLIKFMENAQKASKLLEQAHQVMESTEHEDVRNDVHLKSRLARMRGIAAGACAQKADQETRPALHASYLEHLTEAAALEPTSFENLYHLACAQAELRDIDAALVSARTAVEINPNHTNAWHLLCLLTSASKELKLALDIAEVGLVNAEDVGDGDTSIRTPQGESNTSRDTSLPGSSSTEETHVGTSETSGLSNIKSALGPIAGPNIEALSEQAGEGHLAVPAASSRIRQEHSLTPPISQGSQEKLEFSCDPTVGLEANIRLRITKNVLIESLQGPEVALSDQQNLFAYFAQAYSQIYTQDILQMGHSQSKSNTNLLSSPNSKNSLSSSPPTPKSSPRGSRFKAKKAYADLKVSNSIRRRSQISQVLHAHKHRSYSGASNLVAMAQQMANIALQDGAEKKESLENPKSVEILQDLWLMSAATFRRWGKTEECKGAIQEAERLNGERAELWVQYGLYCLSINDLNTAIESLMKAIGFKDDHIPAMVHLSRILKEQGSIELVEGFLDLLTQTVAWDVPEAWFLLSQIYLSTDRIKRAEECLLYSLSLEESKPIRPLRLCVPFCL